MKTLMLIGCVLAAAGATAAETTRYAVEQSEFTVRIGKSYQNRGVATIKSGESVTVLEDDPEQGWSRIQTAGGIEGWIQTKYLTDQVSVRSTKTCPPAASTKLKDMNEQLNRELVELRARIAATPSPAACLTATATTPEPCAPVSITITPAPTPKDSTPNKEDLQTVRRDWFLGGALITLIGAFFGRLLAKTRFARE